MNRLLARPWTTLLFAALAFGLFLGTRGLNEPDEGRYAELGREMAVPGGDWLVPHLNGFEHFQKPPLLYWATAASLRTFGVNDWAARAPSALAALGTVALTLWIGAALFGLPTGLLAALVLVSMAEFFGLARGLTPDMLLTFWVTAAAACLVRHARGEGRKWGWLFFVAMGLGFLTKGPMALVVPVSAALAWQFTARRAGSARALPWAGGIVLTFAIGLAWFVVLSAKEARLFDYFWRYELVERFASKAHGRSKPFWFFLPVLLVGALPWTFLFPVLARAAWHHVRARTAKPAHWLLFGWCVPPFLILSLSGSKLFTYILPLLPALALALAAWLTRRGKTPRWAVPLAVGFTSALVVVAAFIPRWNDSFRQQASVRELAAILSRRADFDRARLFACEVRAHGFEFYLGRLVSATRGESDIVLPTSPEQQARVIESGAACERQMLPAKPGDPPACGLVRSARFEKSFTAARWEVLGRAGDFLLIASRKAEGSKQ